MRSVIAALLVGLVGCAGPRTSVGNGQADSVRLENLRRAARLPWADDGYCAVHEASGGWRTLVERCYGALDRSRIRFQDVQRRCALAQLDGATLMEVEEVVGVCLLVQPELAVGAVIIIGAVVVAAAIAAEIEAADRAKRPPKWCNCYCGRDPQPALLNTQDFECRSECVLQGYAPTDYVCR
jgi:hypothetical protein